MWSLQACKSILKVSFIPKVNEMTLWPFVCPQDHWKSDPFFVLASTSLISHHPLSANSGPLPASTDHANIVSESTVIVDVSPSITTNVIGQKTDEVGPDMCERSCEELSTLFQELKGLRVVVGNLIDGLQKVVSASVFFCLVFVLLQIDHRRRCCCCRGCPKKTNILERIDILRK